MSDMSKQPHYTNLALEPIDVMKANFTDEEFRGYLHGNIIKYVMRYKNKGVIQDLEKASVYLGWLRAHLKEEGSKVDPLPTTISSIPPVNAMPSPTMQSWRDIPIKEDLIKSADRDHLAQLSNLIGSAFTWDNTPEGFPFWASLANNLEWLLREVTKYRKKHDVRKP